MAHTPPGPQLLRELAPAQHPNIVSLEDIFLSPQDKSLYMVFEFADYNLFVRALDPMRGVVRVSCSVVLMCARW